MGASEAAYFDVYVRHEQADRALEDLRGKTEKAVTAGGNHARTLEAVDRASKKAAQASGLLGGELGQLAGSASRAAGDVVDLVEMLSGSGFGLTAAAATASVAVGALAVGALYQAEQQAKKARAEFDKWVQSAKKGDQAELASTIKATQDLARELENLGKSTRQITRDELERARGLLAVEEVQTSAAIAALMAQKDAAEQKLTDTKLQESAEGMAQQALARGQLRVLDASLARARDRLPIVKAETVELDKQLKAANELLRIENEKAAKQGSDAAGKALRGLAKDGDAAAREAFERARGVTPDAIIAARYGLTPEIRRAIEDNDKDINKAREDLRKQDEDFARNHENAKLAIKGDALKREREMDEEAARAREDLAKQTVALNQQVYAQGIGIAVNASQQLIDNLITGQEHAVELFAATMSKQVGSALIGHGINALAGGLASQALVLAPATGGVSAIVTGGALIAAGLALGGLGTGIEHGLAGSSGGAGGGRGSGIVTQDRGASTGTRDAFAGRATYVFNTTYGVYGPSAEDAARENERIMRTAQDRGLAP